MPIKICVLGDKAYYERILPDNPYLTSDDCLFLGHDATDDEVVAAMPDAEVLLVDAITPVTANLIERLPNLRLVNSEGVAFDKIDLESAAAHGVYVCNNQGMNAGAVAEQTILLMLGLLRGVVPGDAAVRAGRQMEVKMRGMRDGIADLADCTVGIVGLGCIGRATAERLRAFGTRVVYTGRTRKDPALEAELGVSYVGLDEMLPQCDFVSIHCAVTPQTTGMVDDTFLARMRPDAYLVNTARGEIVDNDALARSSRGPSRGRGSTPSSPNRSRPTTSCSTCRPRRRGASCSRPTSAASRRAACAAARRTCGTTSPASSAASGRPAS